MNNSSSMISHLINPRIGAPSETCKKVLYYCYKLDCCQVFVDKKLFNTHLREHYSVLPYYCYECSAYAMSHRSGFYALELVSMHLLFSHRAYLTRSWPKQCRVLECQESFGDERECLLHYEKHDINLTFRCEDCLGKYGFELLGHLMEHVKEEHPRNVQYYQNKYRHKLNVNTKMLEKELENRQSALGNDKRVVNGKENAGMSVGKFMCPNKGCKEGFKTKHGLNMHENLHTTFHPYKCDKCTPGSIPFDNGFPTQSSLMLHTQSVHCHRNVTQEMGNRDLKCNAKDCDQRFDNRAAWEKHRISHVQKYSCLECSQKAPFKTVAFSTAEELVRHKARHPSAISVAAKQGQDTSKKVTSTPPKQYPCMIEGCKSTFSTRPGLASHLRSHSRAADMCVNNKVKTPNVKSPPASLAPTGNCMPESSTYFPCTACHVNGKSNTEIVDHLIRRHQFSSAPRTFLYPSTKIFQEENKELLDFDAAKSIYYYNEECHKTPAVVSCSKFSQYQENTSRTALRSKGRLNVRCLAYIEIKRIQSGSIQVILQPGHTCGTSKPAATFTLAEAFCHIVGTIPSSRKTTTHNTYESILQRDQLLNDNPTKRAKTDATHPSIFLSWRNAQPKVLPSYLSIYREPISIEEPIPGTTKCSDSTIHAYSAATTMALQKLPPFLRRIHNLQVCRLFPPTEGEWNLLEELNSAPK